MRLLCGVFIALIMLAIPAGASADAIPGETMQDRRMQRLRQRIVDRQPVAAPRTVRRRPPSRRQRAPRLSPRRLRGTSSFTEQQRKLLHTAVNEVRAHEGLQPLRRNDVLDIAAQRHAADMVHRNYFDHASPEGVLYDKRMRDAGYPGMTAESCGCNFRVFFGENSAKGQRTAGEVVNDWMDSPPHRANLLDPIFDDVGYGIMRDVWVQNLGRILRTEE